MSNFSSKIIFSTAAMFGISITLEHCGKFLGWFLYVKEEFSFCWLMSYKDVVIFS